MLTQIVYKMLRMQSIMHYIRADLDKTVPTQQYNNEENFSLYSEYTII